jgi:hypothetical protein
MFKGAAVLANVVCSFPSTLRVRRKMCEGGGTGGGVGGVMGKRGEERAKKMGRR